MVTRLKAKDLPEPWIDFTKKNGGSSKQKSNAIEVTTVKESSATEKVNLPNKRGRGRPKAQLKVVDSRNRKGKGKTLHPSAIDVVLGQAKTPVQDPNELRQKIAEDAIACGRNVRTVFEPAYVKNRASTMMNDAAEGVCSGKTSTTMASAIRYCPPKSSWNVAGIEDQNQVEEGDVRMFEQTLDEQEPPFFQHSGEEHMPNDVQQAMRGHKSEQSRIHLQRHDIDFRNDVALQCSAGEGTIRNFSQTPSPVQAFKDDRYQGRQSLKKQSPGRQSLRTQSPGVGRLSNQRRFSRSRSRSPTQNGSRSNATQRLQSPQHTYSGSPQEYRREREGERIIPKFIEYDDRHAYSDRFQRDYKDNWTFNSGERGQRRTDDSLSPENEDRNNRSYSPEYGQSNRRRTVTMHSSMSPPRNSRIASNSRGTVRTSSDAVYKEEKLWTLPAVERKERRYKQSFREAQMAEREKFGQKPFYLTLDPQGRPYGIGKPAWIATINKLAAGLDPSCTHIRKQTFEDVQTFKERLNETFDYSGTLNDDHLRGLMGKAVTKRRGELILLIQNNGKQPLNIDEDVWIRLKKLANSRQREEKSEQGRYANACRKTLGRTGSQGIDGIREKLRSLLRRSPHPYEVEEEMQRDKGFGGRRRKVQTILVESKDGVGERIFSDEDEHSESLEKHSDGHVNDATYNEQQRRVGRHVQEKSGRSGDYSQEDSDVRKQPNASGRRSYNVNDIHRVSTNEYIEELKAEIERLQAEKQQDSISTTVRASQSTMSTAQRMRGRQEVVQLGT